MHGCDMNRRVHVSVLISYIERMYMYMNGMIHICACVVCITIRRQHQFCVRVG